MNDDALADRRRASEEDYFRKRDSALIEEIQKRAESDAARRRLSQRLGITDDDLLGRLLEVGFSEEIVPLIHVLPLVQVAWIEGTVSPRASQQIVETARRRGIDELSPADRQLTEWLRSRPADALYDAALEAIRAILQQGPGSERESASEDLLERCTAVAAASGGVLGFGKISALERNVLDYIRRALQPAQGRSNSAD
jgi:hypothetical protein